MRSILGSELQRTLCEALGIDLTKTRRIVIDVQINKIDVYIEQIGDERLLAIDWPGHLKQTGIHTEEKK